MNVVNLTGHLTRAVELKMTPAGIPVANLGIAVNERWIDSATGEVKENAVFVECEAWNKTAESLFEYFRKGDPILIQGSLKFESWESEGQRRSRLKVRISRWEFMQRRPDNPEATPEPAMDTDADTEAPVVDEKAPF